MIVLLGILILGVGMGNLIIPEGSPIPTNPIVSGGMVLLGICMMIIGMSSL